MVTLIAGPTLNVTATIRDKGKKGIRIRKTKESEGTILSVTASQLVCRPSGKHLLTGWCLSMSVCLSVPSYLLSLPSQILLSSLLSAYIDGLEWSSLSSLRLTAQWEQTAASSVPLSLIKNFSTWPRTVHTHSHHHSLESTHHHQIFKCAIKEY